MKLTPEFLASGYDFLRHAKPFSGWNLPEPEDIRFGVLRTSYFGDCGRDDKGPYIRVSERMHDRCVTVMMTLAHEMIHLHMHSVACGARHKRLRTDSANHGPAFRGFAKQVCAAFPEFDPVTF